MPVTQLLYVSDATHLMAEPELREMIGAAQRNNSHFSITGLLLYSRGNFMQLLEGNGASVLPLFGRIQRDQRHRNVELFHQERVDHPLFPNWSMGLLNLDDPAVTIDRAEMRHVIDRAKMFRTVGSSAGKAALELLKEFRRKLPAAETIQQ